MHVHITCQSLFCANHSHAHMVQVDLVISLPLTSCIRNSDQYSVFRIERVGVKNRKSNIFKIGKTIVVWACARVSSLNTGELNFEMPKKRREKLFLCTSPPHMCSTTVQCKWATNARTHHQWPNHLPVLHVFISTSHISIHFHLASWCQAYVSMRRRSQ